MPLRHPPAAGRRPAVDHRRGDPVFRLKTPWSDGTTHLVPPPRLNLVRYHGVLAPSAADRAQIVPGVPADEAETGGNGEPTPAGRGHRLAWAVLLARVFRIDVTRFPGRQRSPAPFLSPHDPTSNAAPPHLKCR